MWLDSLPFCLFLGTALGFLGGLGVGGGSLLVLWLTEVLAMDQRMAQGINLLFFLPAALLSAWLHSRNGQVDKKVAWPAMAAGAAAAALCAWISAGLDLSLLRKLFGGLMTATGIRELYLCYRQRKER